MTNTELMEIDKHINQLHRLAKPLGNVNVTSLIEVIQLKIQKRKKLQNSINNFKLSELSNENGNTSIISL